MSIKIVVIIPKLENILMLLRIPILSPKIPTNNAPIGKKPIANWANPWILPLRGFGVWDSKILECIFIKKVVIAPNIAIVMHPATKDLLFVNMILPAHNVIVANAKINPGLEILTNKGKKIIEPNRAPKPWRDIIKENCSGVAS